MRSARAIVAACHSKACAPPPAGKGGSTPGGPFGGATSGSKDAILNQWSESRQRTTPGPGAGLKDDGHPGDKSIRIRSIPNVATARLKRRAEHINKTINTPEGLHKFDEPRRSLIHLGVNLLAIKHELRLRGEA